MALTCHLVYPTDLTEISEMSRSGVRSSSIAKILTSARSMRDVSSDCFLIDRPNSISHVQIKRSKLPCSCTPVGKFLATFLSEFGNIFKGSATFPSSHVKIMHLHHLLQAVTMFVLWSILASAADMFGLGKVNVIYYSAALGLSEARLRVYGQRIFEQSLVIW